MRIEANSEEELRNVNEAIHDQWFEVSEVEYDQGAGIVRVPFERKEKRTGRVADSARWILEIRDVSNCVVEESEGIGRYDFNMLQYLSVANRLMVQTGIPLTFYLDVGNIQVTVSLR